MSLFNQCVRAMVFTAAAVTFTYVPLVNAAQGQAAPATSSGAAQSQNLENPSEVVKTAAESMLKDLDANREMYRKDPAKVAQLVDKYLLPHFDVETSARAVLGAHGKTATPDQHKRFVDAFYHSLVTNYGNALVDFTSDKLKILPTNVGPNDPRATVRSKIKRGDGDLVEVDYSMRKTEQGWKVWDVVIDGISYVKSYHDDFDAQIDKEGLDAVIARLQKGEKPSDINKTVKKTSDASKTTKKTS
jgi:phospholipid transport system substrate-binding protein